MTVDAVNVRCSEIEQTWQAASASGHLGYLDELAEMAGALEQMTGSQAVTSTRSRTVLTTSPKPEGQPCNDRFRLSPTSSSPWPRPRVNPA